MRVAFGLGGEFGKFRAWGRGRRGGQNIAGARGRSKLKIPSVREEGGCKGAMDVGKDGPVEKPRNWG